ncbi:MAG: hypothetical protein KGJ55_05895 [Gammaproteobacteria bacterium]|nr:hypothetical protein [Gammaproteobacteria bacterium]
MGRVGRKILAWTGGVLGALALLIAASIWLFFVPSAKELPYRLVASWGGLGAAPGQFDGPNGIAVGGGRVYVADSLNHRIQIFDSQGHFLSDIAVGPQGLLPKARPMNLNVAGDKLYVADYWNDAVQVYTLDGRLLRAFGGKTGSGPGQFHAPGGASAKPDGTIVVADFYNQRVQWLSSGGAFLRQVGVTGQKGFVAAGRFNYPTDVAVDPGTGNVYVADGYNDRIQVFDAQGRFLRMWGGAFGLHLPAAINFLGGLPGWFRTPTSIAIGPHGDVFVADQENNRLQKFTAAGRFLTAFGHPPRAPGYSVGAVAAAAGGSVYVTDPADQRVERWVRRAALRAPLAGALHARPRMAAPGSERSH